MYDYELGWGLEKRHPDAVAELAAIANYTLGHLDNPTGRGAEYTELELGRDIDNGSVVVLGRIATDREDYFGHGPDHVITMIDREDGLDVHDSETVIQYQIGVGNKVDRIKVTGAEGEVVTEIEDVRRAISRAYDLFEQQFSSDE